MPARHDDLEPIDPRTVQELFLDHKATNCTKATVQNQRYRTNHFVRWCDEVGFENLNELTGHDIQKYRLWRKDDGDLNKMTMRAQMSTLRVFLKWAGSIEAVPEDLYNKVMVPRARPDEANRDETLDASAAKEILDYLSRYEYSSIEHAGIGALWETGIRLGVARSLDVSDVDFDAECLQIVHRPDKDTRLKNGRGGERPVAMTPELMELLEDYLEMSCEEVTDDYSRKPLFTTRNGRMHRNTMRRIVYRVTAPCYRGDPCPNCRQGDTAKCPEAVGPHTIRRGSITHFLSKDVPVEIVSDRIDVSRKVLDKHYDKRSAEVKLEQRRGYLDNI